MAGLAAALAVVALVVVHPYYNVATGNARSFPTHMDEYVHWGAAQAVLETGSVAVTHPFLAGGGEDFSFATHLHERGFHAYVAVVKDATGLPWEKVFAILPTLMWVLAAAIAFVIGRRWGAGVETVLWFAAVPTTLRFLGPAFLVPIAFSIPFILLGIHVLLAHRGFGASIVLAILCAALWPLHAMGALVLLSACGLAALASARSPARAASILGIAAVPALIAFPFYSSSIEDPVFLSTLPPDLDAVRLAGPGLFVLAAIGVAILSLRRETLAPAVVMGGLLVASYVIVIRRMTTGEDLYRIYDRTVTLLSVLAAFPAGAGIAWIRRALAARGASLRIPGAAAIVVVLLLAAQGGMVWRSASAQMAQEYYEPVTAERFAEYKRAADLLGPEHKQAVVEGQTIPFTIATGIPAVYVFLPSGQEPPESIERFWQGGAKDTMFLLTTGTSVVVTPRAIDNPYLVRVTETVYALRPDVMGRLAPPS